VDTTPEDGEVTLLLHRVAGGDSDAESRLLSLIYAELHRMAGRYMRRERTGHTLQATALVNEAYLRLVDQAGQDWKSRAHFFAVAAQVMRRVLVDHARHHLAQKRGQGMQQVTLDDQLAIGRYEPELFLSIDEALTRLAQWDARQCQVVEMRFFAGLTDEETAEALGISVRTVQRDWGMAKAWLMAELSG
jgi:RNA polymerase sigma-70 factor, ECF subfamily